MNVQFVSEIPALTCL